MEFNSSEAANIFSTILGLMGKSADPDVPVPSGGRGAIQPPLEWAYVDDTIGDPRTFRRVRDRVGSSQAQSVVEDGIPRWMGQLSVLPRKIGSFSLCQWSLARKHRYTPPNVREPK